MHARVCKKPECAPSPLAWKRGRRQKTNDAHNPFSGGEALDEMKTQHEQLLYPSWAIYIYIYIYGLRTPHLSYHLDVIRATGTQ